MRVLHCCRSSSQLLSGFANNRHCISVSLISTATSSKYSSYVANLCLPRTNMVSKCTHRTSMFREGARTVLQSRQPRHHCAHDTAEYISCDSRSVVIYVGLVSIVRCGIPLFTSLSLSRKERLGRRHVEQGVVQCSHLESEWYRKDLSRETSRGSTGSEQAEALRSSFQNDVVEKTSGAS